MVEIQVNICCFPQEGFEELGGDGRAEADSKADWPSAQNGFLICQPQEDEEQTTMLAEENDDRDDNAVTEHGNIVTHDRPVVWPQDSQYSSSFLGTSNTEQLSFSSPLPLSSN